ncbi:photosynthetic complex putative assembly protein PuhB [Tateyamaria omphalii]|uniref:photosynthetic complex putative assembly protein PuhB n=1 Tax=Tateyamaria omphalii TaxID=299262 RepID=UPI0034A0C0C3
MWQGRPDTSALARDALNINWVMGYFVVLAAWRFISVIDLMPIGQAIGATLPFFLMGAVAWLLLYGIALIQARATMYTITTSRIAMRIGAALTLTINLPYRELGNAALDLRKNGTGTIALDTTGETKLSYLVLWPHARPWTFGNTQPALRCIPNAERVARILADAAEARISTPQITRIAPGDAVAAE